MSGSIKCWKVVCEDDNRRLLSCIDKSEHQELLLRYSTTHSTKPYPGTGILAFESVEMAEAFFNTMSNDWLTGNIQLWEARYWGKKQEPRLTSIWLWDLEDILKKWKGIETLTFHRDSNYPPDTIAVKCLRLIKKLSERTQ